MRSIQATMLFSLLPMSASAALHYDFLVVPLPARMQSSRLVAVSRHGTYFITQTVDFSNRIHYLLYGPNSTTRYEDLSGSAGPLGPTTGGPLWPGTYSLVNDKGVAVAKNGGAYSLYFHQTHTLLPIPPSVTPQAINNRNNIAGAINYTTSAGKFTSAFGRWNYTTGEVKAINPDPNFHWQLLNGYLPGGNLDARGNTTDLSDSDEQIGTANGAGRDGHFSGYFGFEYLVGSPAVLGYGSGQAFPVGYDFVNRINDNHKVTGYGFYSDGHNHSFVGDLTGQNPRFLAAPAAAPNGDAYAQGIDNDDRVLGHDDNGNLYVWDTDGTPYGWFNLNASIPNTTFSNVQMAVSGSIFGYLLNGSGHFQVFVLRPSP